MKLVKNIRHVGLVVNNLDKSCNFFKNILGFKVIKRSSEDIKLMSVILKKKKRLKTIKLSAPGGGIIELLKFSSRPINKNQMLIDTHGLTHVSFTVTNVNIIYNILKKKNFVMLSQPQISADKCHKLFFVKSFDNLYLEFVEVLQSK